jgi:hypothetical protein
VNLGTAWLRALAGCAWPRVWLLGLAPLVLLLLAVAALSWWLWEPMLDAVQALVGRVEVSEGVFRWLHAAGWPQLRAVLAPMVVVVLALPLVLVAALVLVAVLASPGLAAHIVARRWPSLQRSAGCGWPRRIGWTLGTVLAALLALLASLPLWLVPPLVLLLPDHALAAWASAEERRQVRRGRRASLALMGAATGAAALLPMGLWGLGSMAFVLAPFFMLAAAALFVAVFMFAALWFSEVALAELARLRGLTGPV